MRLAGSGLGAVVVGGVMVVGSLALAASSSLPQPVSMDTGWQLAGCGEGFGGGAAIAAASFKPQGWYAATVPGTVLTSLVNERGVSGAFVWGEQSAGQDSGQLVADAFLVSDGGEGSEGLCGEACVAEF